MQARTTIIFICFVVIPTAVLSVLAGRALLHWELVLRGRTESGAQAVVEAVDGRIHTRLSENLEHIETAMKATLERPDKGGGVAGVAQGLKRSMPLAAEVYLFMNPWGLVVPESDIGAQSQSVLVDELRAKIAGLSNLQDRFSLNVSGACYYFVALTDRKTLYAGYRISKNGLLEYVQTLLDEASGERLLLELAGQEETSPNGVVVTDSLSSFVSGEHRAAMARGAVVLETSLSPPLENIRVNALMTDPAEARQASETRVKIYGWGVIVLALGIVGGAWVFLREAVEEARRARARSNLVVGVSHDLRTPVASMRMLAESLLMERVKDSETQKQFLGTIVRESERLGQLVERVIFIVRYGQKALVYRLKPEDPCEVASSALRAFEARSSRVGEAATGEGIEMECAENIPRARIDRTALIEAILNLLDNAAKYGGSVQRSAPATPATLLSIRTLRARKHRLARERQWVCISVKDSGPGIDRKDAGKIFKPFHRLPGAVSSNVSGVGLGLALCRHIARAHGGWIDVESEIGKGSTFSIYLPVG